MKTKNPLIPIFLIVLVDILGLTIILPLLPFYAEKYGGSPSVYGLLVASYALCQFIAGPLLGRISDVTGRKPLLIVSQVGTFAGFLILAGANSLWMIFLSRIIDGLTAGNLSLAQAYISDVTAPQNRAKAFGIIGISFGIGFLIGPALSGYLSQFGYYVPALAAAALSFTSIMATTFLLPPVDKVATAEARAQRAKTHAEEEKKNPGVKKRKWTLFQWGHYVKFFEDPTMRSFLIQFFLFCFSFAMFISGFALFSERRFTLHDKPFGPREVGYMMAYNGLLGILIQGGILGRLVKKIGEEKVALAGSVTMGLGYLLLGFVFKIPVVLLVVSISSFGSGVLRPVLTSLITKRAQRTEQGTVLGLTQSLNSVAQIAGPILAGFLIGNGNLMAWAAVAGAAGFGILFFAKPEIKKV